MHLPGRMDTQRALIADYAHYVARFDAIAEYLARWQPPSLMLWGRHDAILRSRRDPVMDAGLCRGWKPTFFDAGHMLLETHAAAAASLMLDFIRRTQRKRAGERGGHR